MLYMGRRGPAYAAVVSELGALLGKVGTLLEQTLMGCEDLLRVTGADQQSDDRAGQVLQKSDASRSWGVRYRGVGLDKLGAVNPGLVVAHLDIGAGGRILQIVIAEALRHCVG